MVIDLTPITGVALIAHGVPYDLAGAVRMPARCEDAFKKRRAKTRIRKTNWICDEQTCGRVDGRVVGGA